MDIAWTLQPGVKLSILVPSIHDFSPGCLRFLYSYVIPGSIFGQNTILIFSMQKGKNRTEVLLKIFARISARLAR